MTREKLPLGITIGDMNGVSPELILNIIQSEELLNYCVPVIYSAKGVLEFYANELDMEVPVLNTVKKQEDLVETSVNVRYVEGGEQTPEPGIASELAGKVAKEALELAVKDIKLGLIKNVVTGPIDKKSIKQAGFSFPGHTEYFATEFESDDYMMLLCSDELVIGTVTGHVPVSQVAGLLNQDIITKKIEIMLETLQVDFRIKKPKIAVLGLNPHAGDQGAIGNEEMDVIQPVIDAFRSKDELVFGPFSSDGFFGKKAYQGYDGVLAMYHDQALIPFKQISFEDGVNYTAGLPIIRTSPDHGTAYDIAGKGLGSVASFSHAIYMVHKLYRNRLNFFEENKNPLEYSKFKKERFSIGVPDLK